MSKVAKRAVGYVRVSVDSPDKVSPEIQVEAIETLCRSRGWELVHTEVERGKSAGEGKKRPGLDRVRAMIRRGDADTLVVWKLDRCSRSVLDFSVLLAELQKRKADFVSCTESIDTSSPMGVAMVQITMVFAQLERARMGERASAFQAYRRQKGEPPSTPILGYHKVDKRLVIDEEAAPVVKQAVETFLETENVAVAARVLRDGGYPKPSQIVPKLLRSPTLAGIRLDDGVKIPGNWPAIIDVAAHDKVNAILDGRKPGRPTAPKLLLSGIAVCGVCGLPMRSFGPEYRSGGQPGRRRYTCSDGLGVPKEAPFCRMSIYQDHLDRHVEDQLLEWLKPDMWQRIRAGQGDSVPVPVVDTVALQSQLNQLADLWSQQKITWGEWDTARTALLTAIDEADAESVETIDEVDLPDIADLHKEWRAGKLTTEQKRLFISRFIDRIVVKPGFRIPRLKNGWAPVEDRAEIIWR